MLAQRIQPARSNQNAQGFLRKKISRWLNKWPGTYKLSILSISTSETLLSSTIVAILIWSHTVCPKAAASIAVIRIETTHSKETLTREEAGTCLTPNSSFYFFLRNIFFSVIDMLKNKKQKNS